MMWCCWLLALFQPSFLCLLEQLSAAAQNNLSVLLCTHIEPRVITWYHKFQPALLLQSDEKEVPSPITSVHRFIYLLRTLNCVYTNDIYDLNNTYIWYIRFTWYIWFLWYLIYVYDIRLYKYAICIHKWNVNIKCMIWCVRETLHDTYDNCRKFIWYKYVTKWHMYKQLWYTQHTYNIIFVVNVYDIICINMPYVYTNIIYINEMWK